MRIRFVHTPMAVVPVPERELYWRNFDKQYYAFHPNLRPMQEPIWELPHWMHWLAGVLEAAGFNDLGVVDLYHAETNLSGVDKAQVRKLIAANASDYYLFSPMTVNLYYALEIASLIKELHPSAITIFGGVTATPLWKSVAENGSVDYVVIGRGETVLPALLSALKSKTIENIPFNVAFRQNGIVQRGANPELSPIHVSDLPFPKIDLFPRETGNRIRYLRQVYALGCPYECEFCTIQTIGRKPQYFALQRVISEIRAYREYYGRHHHIYFGDETFTLNSLRTLALCDALEREEGIEFDCQTRLNCLEDRTVIKSLARAGCKWIEIGIESLTDSAQAAYKQRVKLNTLRDSLQQLQDVGIGVCSFLINGLPNQSIDDMRRSVDATCELISSGYLQASYLFGMVPYPGSSFYDNPSRHGIELIHHDYRVYHEELPPVYRTKLASSDAIHRVFLESVEKLAQAMAHLSRGVSGVVKEQEFGNFWKSAHV